MASSEDVRSKLFETIQENSGVSGKPQKEEMTKRTAYLGGTPTIEMPEGHVAFSSLFWKPSTIPDIPVPLFKDEDWAEEVRDRIPEFNDKYYLNKKYVEEVLFSMHNKGTVLLYGPTGTGKTSILEQIAAKCRIPFFRVSCHPQQEASEFLGTNSVVTDPESGTPITQHSDTDTTLAFKHGGIWCIDEAFRSPILLSIQSGIEYPHVLQLQDAQGCARALKAPEEKFWAMLTDNTNGTGDHTGSFTAEVQDLSTLNRIRQSVYVDYMSPTEEKKLLKQSFPDIPDMVLKDMIKIANLIRNAFKEGKLLQTMSIRELISWCERLELLRDVEASFRMAVFNRLVSTDQEIVKDCYKQVTATKL